MSYTLNAAVPVRDATDNAGLDAAMPLSPVAMSVSCVSVPSSVTRYRFETPSRSEMKNSDCASGAHCGLMFLPRGERADRFGLSAGRIDQRQPVGADVERIEP